MADQAQAAVDGIDNTHREYDKMLPMWNRCRTVIEGEDAVKAAGQLYLPMLSNQEAGKYEAYKTRAMFYEASGRTLQGMLGALHHEEPALKDPAGDLDEVFFDALVPVHMPFKSFLRDISEEVLTTGRIGVLVDIPLDVSSSVLATPYLASYCAEDVINWRISFQDGKDKLTLVVLQEEVENTTNFKTVYTKQWRVLELINDIYQQSVYQFDDQSKKFFLLAGYPVIPTNQGKPLVHIPFYLINAGGNNAAIHRPPLLPLVNVNLSHYRNSADLEHGRHYTGLPTPWVAGFSTEGGALYMGSEKAWISSEPNAKAGFLEFTGQGLKALETALESKEGLMAILGARLLEAPKKASESAANQVVKHSSENSILANMAETISQGMTLVCQCAAEWQNLDPSNVDVKIETEYLDMQADPQMVAQLTSSLQSGAISYDTYFYNLKRMRLIPDDRTMEEEQDMIDSGKFGGLSGAAPTVPGSKPVKPGAAPPSDAPPSTKPKDSKIVLEVTTPNQSDY